MSILSNYTPECLVKATVECDIDQLEGIDEDLTGEQFAWNVHYPGADGVFGRQDINLIDASNPIGLDRSDPMAKDDITTINQLHLPKGNLRNHWLRDLVDAPELRDVLELPRFEGVDFGPDLLDPQPAPKPRQADGVTSEEGVPS